MSLEMIQNKKTFQDHSVSCSQPTTDDSLKSHATATIDLLTQTLAHGSCRIGEIIIMPDFSLRHVDDATISTSDLEIHTQPEAARQIARYDAALNYRPLKTAPNLRRGWLLQLRKLEEIILALDFFYPAALSLWSSFLQNTLEITPLRETLNRQTGMYRITQLLRDDQAQELVSSFCHSETGCLRKILWKISHDQVITSLPKEKLTVSSIPCSKIPLLCREACNLLVAAARPVAKQSLKEN
ncbi:MAG: DR2241 family protein [Chthoniobacterales bacterium]